MSDAPVHAPPQLRTARGALELPVFLPDATRGVVRCVDSQDLRNVHVEALMVNAFHMMQKPGTRLVKSLGGLHSFAGWDGPIVTDSGGFQVLSLIRRDPRCGVIRPDGVIFRDPNDDSKLNLTPEKVVRAQLQLGADVLIALDDCTGLDSADDEEARSVDRTIRWFKNSREELERSGAQRKLSMLPKLVGVVQGGNKSELRRQCAEALLAAGADALGFGGWPIDDEGVLQHDMIEVVRQTLPADKPLFALGIGKPEHLVSMTAAGASCVFDCTLPTRDARHHRLYVFKEGFEQGPLPSSRAFYEFVYMLDKEHAFSDQPVSASCDCPCCSRYSRGYLHHLFKVKDSLAMRLATLHNLRFYTTLIARLRAGAARAMEESAP